MMFLRRILIYLILPLLNTLFFSPDCNATYSNYNSILIGDQAAGMGGAATAVVGDSSAMSYYNPALLAMTEGQAFSAAVGIYKKFDTVYGLEEDFLKAPLRVNQGFFRSLPASTGNIIRIQDYSVGLSILVPDYDNFKGDIHNDSTNISTLSYVDESLWVGGSIAKKIAQNQSLGMTLYYTARNYLRTISDRSYNSSTDYKVFTSEKTLVQNAIVFQLGYYYQYNDQLALGISARLPSIRVSGQASLFESYSEVTASGAAAPVESSYPNEGSLFILPGKLSAGVSYIYDTSWLISIDGSLYEGLTYMDTINESIASEVKHKFTWNGAIGIEKTFYPWLKARVGWFTNFSSHYLPDDTIQKHQEDHVDQLGFSANVKFIADNKIGYTFGGYNTVGRGKSIQRVNQRYETLTKTQQIFTMLVGTSFQF